MSWPRDEILAWPVAEARELLQIANELAELAGPYSPLVT